MENFIYYETKIILQNYNEGLVILASSCYNRLAKITTLRYIYPHNFPTISHLLHILHHVFNNIVENDYNTNIYLICYLLGLNILKTKSFPQKLTITVENLCNT